MNRRDALKVLAGAAVAPIALPTLPFPVWNDDKYPLAIVERAIGPMVTWDDDRYFDFSIDRDGVLTASVVLR